MLRRSLLLACLALLVGEFLKLVKLLRFDCCRPFVCSPFAVHRLHLFTPSPLFLRGFPLSLLANCFD